MGIHIDLSMQLVWSIANIEAHNANDTVIKPVHYFLGILKVIDGHFLKSIKNNDVDIKEYEKLVGNVKQVRIYLDLTVDKITKLRRAIRKSLCTGKIDSRDKNMLHRSEESRRIFKAFEQKTLQYGIDDMNIELFTRVMFDEGFIKLDYIDKFIK